MSKAKERIGKSNINNQGLKMTIIKYSNCDDIDVIFEDGTRVCNKQYANFKKGGIEHPYFRQKMMIGQESKATNGQTMKICKYINANNVWVKFQDGKVVGPIKLCNFKDGKVENPNCRTNHQISFNELVCGFYFKNIGFEKKSNSYYKNLGMGRMSFDLYNPDLKIAIEYDGYGHSPQKDSKKNEKAKKLGIKIIRIREAHQPQIADNNNVIFILNDNSWFSNELLSIIRTIHCQICSQINICSKLNINKETDLPQIYDIFLSHQPGRKYVGQHAISSHGQDMEIIEYFNHKNITVRFSDGTVVKNARIEHFFTGKIRNPNFYPGQCIGEIRTMLNGQKATIIKYINWNDIDIKFEDGTINKGVNYSAFKDGRVKNENYLNLKWQGQKFVNKKGLTAEITHYEDYHHVEIIFEDGTTIVTRMDLLNEGTFNNPNDTNGKVGEISYTKNGEKMRIIAHRNAKDIDVIFDDGTISKNKRYEHFLNGLISKHNP